MMFFHVVTAVDRLDELFDRLLSLRCRNVLLRDPPVCFLYCLRNCHFERLFQRFFIAYSAQ